MSINEIKKLPNELINQIKAGEVVERPYNVIKELLENSIDAGAKSIFIELLDGGKQLIRITDDGSGIPSMQLSIAIERHATNKITAFSDLEKLHSFGFRGEALASIAAVSHFTIKSRINAEEMGREIAINCGQILSEKDVLIPVGTCVQVKDIFAGVPARLKFLKSTATEYAHIHDFLIAMSMAYFNISLKLSHNGRVIFHHYAKKKRQERFQEILGLDTKEFTEVEFSRGSFQLRGFAGLPDAARTTPQYFMTFINGRYVKDKVLRAGILQAYQGLLLKGLVPSAIIFVEVDPTWVDINAHPSKIEVRFYDSPAIQDLVAMGIQNGVKKSVMQHARPEPASTVYTTKSYDSRNNIPQYHNNKFEVLSSLRNTPSMAEKDDSIISSYNLPIRSKQVDIAPPQDNIIASVDTVLPSNDIESFSNKASIFQSAKFLGQYANCYLILEIKDELWLIDQHAFHERILFEEILIAHKKSNVLKQELLTPIIILGTTIKSDIVLEKKEEISSLGFEIEKLKSGDLAIHAFPSFLSTQKAADIFKEIVEKILSSSHLESTDVFHLLFATMACHSAIRAGDPLNEELVRRLLKRADDVDFYAHCPHGRPVIRKFTHKDIASWFQRL